MFVGLCMEECKGKWSTLITKITIGIDPPILSEQHSQLISWSMLIPKVYEQLRSFPEQVGLSSALGGRVKDYLIAWFPFNKIKKYHSGHSCRNAIELFMINWSTVRSWGSTRSHCNCFIDTDVHPINVGFAICVINLNNHLYQLPRHVSIFFKVNISTWNTFTETTATGNLSRRCFILTFNHPCFS